MSIKVHLHSLFSCYSFSPSIRGLIHDSELVPNYCRHCVYEITLRSVITGDQEERIAVLLDWRSTEEKLG